MMLFSTKRHHGTKVPWTNLTHDHFVPHSEDEISDVGMIREEEICTEEESLISFRLSGLMKELGENGQPIEMSANDEDSAMRSPQMNPKRWLKRNEKLYQSTHRKNPVIRYGYNEYMAHQYVYMVKVAEILSRRATRIHHMMANVNQQWRKKCKRRPKMRLGT